MSKSPATGEPRGKPAPATPQTWNFRLYIAGETARSVSTFQNLQRICEQRVAGDCRIEVIDRLRTPEQAKADQIVALPMVVRHRPEPLRRIIGDLSSTAKVIAGLELPQ